jgi:large subunit ribosomal protein L15
MSLVRRVPKRGFHNRFAVTVATVNLRELERLFQAGEEVTPDALRAKGLVRRPFDVLKVLGTGELTKKLRVAAHRFSGSAKARIEAAGGEVVVLPGKTPVADKQNQGA